MNKEQEKQFKEHIKKIAREEIQKTFTDNLMETLNSAFIFEYVETLELKCKKQQEVIDKVIKALEIQIKVIKENPSANALNDNMEIKQREMVINLLKGVSE